MQLGQNWKSYAFVSGTGKSLSEALNFALTNPQYDDRLHTGWLMY